MTTVFSTGEKPLRAEKLNAALDERVLRSGDAMQGPLRLYGNATAPLDAVPFQQMAVIASGALGTIVPPGGSIQAAIDALPTTGGTVILSPNTVYDATAVITTTKPNVRITASSWNTVLRRNPSYTTGRILNLVGANAVVEGFTVDCNSVGVDGTWEVVVNGNGSLVRNMQIINSTGTVSLGLNGQHSRATGNTITGLGVSLSTQRGYGIWAISHVPVMIDHNTITGTGIDGIGFDGEGSQCIGNYVSGCHCYTGGQGGQIATYYGLGGGVGNSIVVAGNYVGAPGSGQGSGVECWNPGMVVSGNTFDNQPAAAITVFTAGVTITGNAIRNCGFDAIVVNNNVTDFVISGNRIADERTTPLMRYAISIYPGTSDRYVITGNLCQPFLTQAIFDGGTGTHKVIANNLV